MRVAAECMNEQRVESRIGQETGVFKILSHLATGEMAEVYLAEDRRLGRQVALKLLSEYFARDQARVRHFQQEARAA